MSQSTLINPIAFLQIHISRLFMERHKLTPEAFLALDSQKNIIGFLRVGYEPFHLTGDEGVLEELDAYVFDGLKMVYPNEAQPVGDGVTV